MKNINRLEEIFNATFSNGKDIIFQFYISFSRLECALKNIPKFLLNSNDKPKVNWTEFDKYIANVAKYESTELQKALKYIIAHPPQEQSIENGRLLFVDSKPTVHELPVYIRRIRNNLFHGGKFNNKNISEISRDIELLQNGLIIINEWINADEEIKDSYFSGL